MRLLIVAIILTSLLIPTTGTARTWHVPTEAPTIQAGVDSAASGDTVLVAPGDYTENVHFWGKSLTVRGEEGPDATFVHGDQGSWAADTASVFRLLDLPDPGTRIEGLTITNPASDRPPSDRVDDGAGVFCSNSSLSIRDCRFVENDGIRSGAISVWESSLVMEDCIIERSSAYEWAALDSEFSTTVIRSSTFADNAVPEGGLGGPGILCFQGILELEDCSFVGNSGYSGGVVWIHEADGSSIVNCDFRENTFLDHVGGVYVNRSEGVVVEDCAFLGNEAESGGALSTFYAGPVVRGCLFRGNRVSDNGGAVLADGMSPTPPTYVACIFDGNSAGMRGGAIASYRADVVVDSCTIYGNEGTEGGGIYINQESGLNLRRSIVSDNVGIGIWRIPGPYTCELSCNDVWNNIGGDYIGCLPGEGDFSLDPRFCDPLGGDFTLNTHSPCLPGQHPHGYDCGLIGAYGLGCGATATVPTTWGILKSLFEDVAR